MSSAEQDVRLRRPVPTSSSRSPHPYHRRSSSLKQEEGSTSSPDTAFYNVASTSDSTDDHAIEADDEKGPLLRLPAPPLRPHKGLKGQLDPSIDLTPAISPIPSPAIEKSGFVFTSKVAAQQKDKARQDKDELYARYARRRRAEVVRRLTEAVLLLTIGVLCALNRTTHAETSIPGVVLDAPEMRYKLLTCFSVIVFLCYAIYPVQTAVRFYVSGQGAVAALRKGFHIPSRFDTGILLYPVLMPLFITLSLGNTFVSALVNVILGLASMPRQIIPSAVGGSGYLHWVLSLTSISLLWPLQCQPGMLRVDMGQSFVNFEELSLLFPLHQTVVKVISDMVATSLDPSEVQLLSAGLINLLFFASSPPSQILKALLWVGGLSLFVCCEFALRAEVALARIPAWKFARNRPSNRGITGRLNRILRAVLPETRSVFAVSVTSDSEDAILPKVKPVSRRPRRTRTAALQDDSVLHRTISADEGPNGLGKSTSPAPKISRSSTFSMYGRATSMAVKFKKIAESPNPYPRLNLLHAQALKILLAVYVFAATALIILVPVRYFISTNALHGAEPIGWAVGYFFGDIPQLRMFVVNNNLNWWIKLPPNKSQVSSLFDQHWVDNLRRQDIGAANYRLLLAGYCVFVVGIGILAVLQLQKVVEVDTRRKVFHGVMVAMLLPTIPMDPVFFALALIIVLAVFLMLDLFRASQLPPISRPLTNFLAPYVDGRDHRGPVIVSHIFLLIGCAIPLWLSLADTQQTEDAVSEGWEVSYRNLSMVSGVICVGMGDAAASLVGRRYGRTKWYWGGGKSLEGSAAFAIAVWVGLMVSWLWLRAGGWVEFNAREVPGAMWKALAAGTGASIMESTLTAANDNVVVPIGLWLLVRGLRI